MTGGLFIPPELLSAQEQKVLHLSDTPTSLYPAIGRLIDTIQPGVIIHTGDLADDLKLQYSPHILDVYTRSVRPFLAMLEQAPVQKIYIVPGNHDNRAVLEAYLNKTELVIEGTRLEIGNTTFGVAHKFKRLPQQADFSLYGHNFKMPVTSDRTTQYLNGLQAINIILLPSRQVVKISYPWSTNRDRKMDQSTLPKTI